CMRERLLLAVRGLSSEPRLIEAMRQVRTVGVAAFARAARTQGSKTPSRRGAATAHARFSPTIQVPAASTSKAVRPCLSLQRQPSWRSRRRGGMRLKARLERELKFVSGLNRTLGRVKSIAADSPNLICDDLQAAVDRKSTRLNSSH